MVEVSRSFAIGLCAYLRQLSLSIDRANESLTILKHYLESDHSLPIADVVLSLQQRLPSSAFPVTPSEPCRQNIIFSSFDWFLRKHVRIPEQDMLYILQNLELLQRILTVDTAWSADRMNRLRIDLDRAYQALSSRLVGKALHERIAAVNHLNASSYMHTNTIESLAGTYWLPR